MREQLAGLGECLRIITGKAGVYERHLADGTAADLWDVMEPAGSGEPGRSNLGPFGKK